MRKHSFNTLILNADCPDCETNSAIIQQRIVNLEGIGRVLRIGTHCQNCYYTNREFVPFNSRRRSVVRFRIKDKLDLNAKVIKSQSCTFKIPELGLELEPGPESQAEIINVNSVLSNITLALEYEYGSNKLSKAIKRIREGKSKATLVLDDPTGASTVIPQKLGKT